MSEAVFVHDAYKEFGNLYGPLSRLVHRLETVSGRGYYQRAGLPIAPVVVAVNHVSFSVEKGEIFGVSGPSGSGKSTLIRLLATQLVPDGGDLRIFGYDVVRQPDQVQRLINRVSVEASFFMKRSPLENLVYSARLYGISGQEARQQAAHILARLGADPRTLHTSMDNLPRDVHQKVAIARALLSRQRLLLLDEPTSNLDQQAKRAVWDALGELRDQSCTTILVTTRDAQEAEQLCDRVACFDQGEITQTLENLNSQRTIYEYTDAVV
jgi:ABC-2 type transport system ATP-binding protein